jgi:hypothetical protein
MLADADWASASDWLLPAELGWRMTAVAESGR